MQVLILHMKIRKTSPGNAADNIMPGIADE
jgi:hypothetical protein